MTAPALMSTSTRRLISVKWPTLKNQRSPYAAGPYLVLDGTLDECLRDFIGKAGRNATPLRGQYAGSPPGATSANRRNRP
jgi:hypothetical protein